MHALPPAPPPAPRRQLFVGTAIASASAVMIFSGLLAVFLRFRQDALSVAGGEWKPADVVMPEVPTNINLVAFLFVGIFAQWAVYAARRQYRSQTALAIGCVALIGIAIVNGQAFVYRQMGMGIADGTYQVMFYAITGLFVALTVAGIVFSIVTAFRYLGGRTSEQEIVSAHAMYWYALSAIYCALWFWVFVTK